MMNISFEVIAIAALVTALVTLVLAYSKNAHLRAQLEQQQALLN